MLDRPTDDNHAPPTDAESTWTGFAPLRQVRAGLLKVGFAELGPGNGPPVILLHGWPYDVHSFAEVAQRLAPAGYRVIVPHLRGHGTTRFRSRATFRNGQQTAFAVDLLALMDALRIRRAVLAGFGWGSRTANITAALWPGRVKALVLSGEPHARKRPAFSAPLPPEQASPYQSLFAGERGSRSLRNRAYRRDLARLVWALNSPGRPHDHATFARSASAFENPDYADVVIHNFRWRIGLAAGEPRYDLLERRLNAGAAITVPAVTIDGNRDPFVPVDAMAAYPERFDAPVEHRTLAGIGHNVPQEAPEDFAQAVIDADHL